MNSRKNTIKFICWVSVVNGTYILNEKLPKVGHLHSTKRRGYVSNVEILLPQMGLAVWIYGIQHISINSFHFSFQFSLAHSKALPNGIFNHFSSCEEKCLRIWAKEISNEKITNEIKAKRIIYIFHPILKSSDFHNHFIIRINAHALRANVLTTRDFTFEFLWRAWATLKSPFASLQCNAKIKWMAKTHTVCNMRDTQKRIQLLPIWKTALFPLLRIVSHVDGLEHLALILSKDAV